VCYSGSKGDIMPAKLSSALPAKLVTVSIRSQLTPTLVVDPSSRGDQGSGNAFGDAIMSLIRPAIYVDTPAGRVTAAPWGEPTRNYLPALIVAGGIGVFAVLGFAYVLGRRSA